MRKYFVLILLVLSFCGLQGASASKVVVVANEADKASLEIARYYMLQRSIPEQNLILLKTRKAEVVSWDIFIKTILNPLRKRLFKDGWIDGSFSEKQKDMFGRNKIASLGHTMDYLVVCRLPIRINTDHAKMKKEGMDKIPKPFQKNVGAVDSELSLLAVGDTPLISHLGNPLFKQQNPNSLLLSQVLKVGRLDGPSVQGVKQMIDGALLAEKQGLLGRAYIDSGGKIKEGDRWIEGVGAYAEAMGYSTSWDKSKQVFDWKDRMDGAAIYFGWYRPSIIGPFADKRFRFAPGALAFHLHSFSAATIRKDNQKWVGPLIDRGASAVLGNVSEPYLGLTHHVHLFMEALSKGWPVGDAVYYALPVLSWQPIFVGDPLYQPFKVTLDDQLEQSNDAASASYYQYAVIRKMETLKSEDKAEEALKLGQRAFVNTPGLALGFEIAKLLRELEGKKDAIKALDFVSYISTFSTEEIGLAYEIADFLIDQGDRKKAFAIHEKIIDHSPLSDKASMEIYPDAILIAKQVGERNLANKWSTTLASLKAEAKRKADEAARKKKAAQDKKNQAKK